MIFATPAASPVMMPEEVPTVATSVALLLHTPPVVTSLKRIVEPWHTTAVGNVIGAGSGFTVNAVVLKQPAGSVYVIVVVPADSPSTAPETGSTDAIVVLSLVHVPPVTPSLRVTVNVAHTCVIPPIAVGVGFTVSSTEAGVHPPVV